MFFQVLLKFSVHSAQLYTAMVFFTCNGCGEALKKNQVEKHPFRCRSANGIDCIDCSKTFTENSWKSHNMCITEEEKYGGKDFVAKPAKNQLKQQSWTEQVHAAIEQCQAKDGQLRNVLERMTAYENIPRKQKPFVNFLVNSLNLRNRAVAERAWELIAQAARSSTVNNGSSSDNNTQLQSGNQTLKRKSPVSQRDQEQNKKHKLEESDTNSSNVTEESIETFKWKSTIKNLLKSAPNHEMKLKKLCKAVRLKCSEAQLSLELSDADLKLQVEQKLQSLKKVEVDGKIARLRC